jgi:hypothetical protein
MGLPVNPIANRDFYTRANPIIKEFIAAAKKKGYKADDDKKTIILHQPNKQFRVFISRVSSVIQFYYLYCGWSCYEYELKSFHSVEDIWSKIEVDRDRLDRTYKCSVKKTNIRNGDFTDHMMDFSEDI